MIFRGFQKVFTDGQLCFPKKKGTLGTKIVEKLKPNQGLTFSSLF